jgi:uncharacterized cupredoxin-like copper-binding protein
MRRSAVALLLAMVVAACGQGSTARIDTRIVEIEMRDFAFSPETLTLRAGEKVTLSFKNVGKLEHEFMVGSDPMIGVGYMNDWFASAGLAGAVEHGTDHAGSGVRVAPNTTQTVTFVVPSQGGVFEFGCFVSGHYEFGMRGRLVVDAEAAPPSTGHATGPQKPASTPAPTHAPMGGDDGEGH